VRCVCARFEIDIIDISENVQEFIRKLFY